MKDITFKKYLWTLVEKHMPVYFMDEEHLEEIINVICQNENMTRREVLILAYSIGANSDESCELLKLKGYEPLYVKKREDAIWKFEFKNRLDSQEIINEIFLQNVDEENF